MFLIIKKRAGIHFLQVQFAEHIQFWAVPNMLQVTYEGSRNPQSWNCEYSILHMHETYIHH